MVMVYIVGSCIWLYALHCSYAAVLVDGLAYMLKYLCLWWLASRRALYIYRERKSRQKFYTMYKLSFMPAGTTN